MSHMMRRRLGSMSDNSAPSSDASEGASEISDSIAHDWHIESAHQVKDLFCVENDATSDSDDTTIDTGMINDQERAQIESFFSGLGTEVFVAASLANLYENIGKDNWRLIYTGVPVLIHDKGSARARGVRRVTFVLAERGTCFALWRDTIDNLSNYKQSGAAFHTMCLSTDHRKIIGFSFDSHQAAREIWLSVEKLISDPENIALSAPGRKHKKPTKKQKIILPPKSQISLPCQFHHVTSVTRNDTSRFFSLQAFISPSSRKRDIN
ncbi:uncharacterized protein LOC134829434 isoform X2 [Culicoides brevitarsis]